MDIFDLIVKLILGVVILGGSFIIAMYATLAERRIAGFIQDRQGPNRNGPFGILQPIADGGKLFMKEETIPAQANRLLFILGPGISMGMALMTSAVVPWGRDITIAGHRIALQMADLNVAILYVFAAVGLGIYGIMVGGWASNNKYSLMGALRASSQMISYELAMGMSAIGVVMLGNSLSLRDIVEAQAGWHWNIFVQPLGFLVFLVTAFAECNRHPFDLAECEAELIAGYHTEYSSMKLGFYLFSEYINMFVSSAIMATLFLGGYQVPFLDRLALDPNLAALIGMVALFIKIFFLIFVFMWVRWTLPRFRYDQLMNLGWKVLFPLAIVNMLWTAGLVAFRGFH
ncbi:MAG TPA: NADH-quinone oxidoreductase subunit NuoH [Rectinemataceae bacterium]|nr:NADH-quinone oxidoreductase subunit NuoH [Rectinemataceae bacterium]